MLTNLWIKLGAQNRVDKAIFESKLITYKFGFTFILKSNTWIFVLMCWGSVHENGQRCRGSLLLSTVYTLQNSTVINAPSNIHWRIQGPKTRIFFFNYSVKDDLPKEIMQCQIKIISKSEGEVRNLHPSRAALTHEWWQKSTLIRFLRHMSCGRDTSELFTSYQKTFWKKWI